MDARSIAATAANKGFLTPATEVDADFGKKKYFFDHTIYEGRVFDSKGVADESTQIQLGPNIKDWPERHALGENVLLKVCSKILDEVTTTDELIPSGETSSYRSNPLGLAEFTLSRRDPAYVGKTKVVDALEIARGNGEDVMAKAPELKEVFEVIHTIPGSENADLSNVEIGSTIYANKPGDGSAREQAASCQRVIGGLANITQDYATKRYRSNVMNWGMLPFHLKGEPTEFEVDDYIFVPGIKQALKDNKLDDITAYVIKNGKAVPISLYIKEMTANEREIVQAGCLINFNRNSRKA
jgi:aconitate hydratase